MEQGEQLLKEKDGKYNCASARKLRQRKEITNKNRYSSFLQLILHTTFSEAKNFPIQETNLTSDRKTSDETNAEIEILTNIFSFLKGKQRTEGNPDTVYSRS